MRRRGTIGRRGFTMIEVMVAVTLLSVLTVGFFMALRVGLNALERTSSRMDDDRRVLGIQRLLRRQAGGIIPAMGSCDGGRATPLFAGNATSLRMVSSESLAGGGRGYPQLLEYNIIAGDLPGSVRLVVTETPYAGPGSLAPLCVAGAPRVGRPFVVADRLAAARFVYLYENPLRQVREWRPMWDPSPAASPGYSLPAAIRIEMASLPTEPLHMRLSPMTLRVRVNRMPGEEYKYDDIEPIPLNR